MAQKPFVYQEPFPMSPDTTMTIDDGKAVGLSH